MEKFEKVKALIADIEVDATKFYGQNNGAVGTRVRKAMQDLKVLAGDIRKEITEKKNRVFLLTPLFIRLLAI